MPAYVIAIRERITDEAEMALYRQYAVTADTSKARGLAVYGRFENLENAPFDTAAIIEFPTFEDAKAWYHSAEYQLAREHRMKGSDFKFMIVEGI